MDRAGPTQDPLYDAALEVAAVSEALVECWTGAGESADPRLSALQVRALLAVRDSPEVNLSRLAEVVGASAPTASRLCDRLEAAGYLRRDRAAVDRREIGLTLTKQGETTLVALFERRARSIYEILRWVPAEQREDLLAGLRAFAAAASRPG